MLFSAVVKQAATNAVKTGNANSRLRLRKAALTLVITKKRCIVIKRYSNSTPVQLDTGCGFSVKGLDGRTYTTVLESGC